MKKILAAATVSSAMGEPAFGQEAGATDTMSINASSLSPADVRTVSPALARYASEDVSNNLWQRPQLSRRDRSLVTLATLVARSQTPEIGHYVGIALDSGVTPSEVSETITHLAFYAGWPNAMGAIAATKPIFEARGIAEAGLPSASPELLPIDEAAENQRAAGVEANVGPVSPGLVLFTADPLFLDLWQRPGLAPRDRSLVTVSSLISSGQSAQVTYHLNRAMDNGLTAEEAGEVVAHVAFYAGWPNAFSAAPVVGEVLRKRAE